MELLIWLSAATVYLVGGLLTARYAYWTTRENDLNEWINRRRKSRSLFGAVSTATELQRDIDWHISQFNGDWLLWSFLCGMGWPVVVVAYGLKNAVTKRPRSKRLTATELEVKALLQQEEIDRLEHELGVK